MKRETPGGVSTRAAVSGQGCGLRRGAGVRVRVRDLGTEVSIRGASLSGRRRMTRCFPPSGRKNTGAAGGSCGWLHLSVCCHAAVCRSGARNFGGSWHLNVLMAAITSAHSGPDWRMCCRTALGSSIVIGAPGVFHRPDPLDRDAARGRCTGHCFDLPSGDWHGNRCAEPSGAGDERAGGGLDGLHPPSRDIAVEGPAGRDVSCAIRAPGCRESATMGKRGRADAANGRSWKTALADLRWTVGISLPHSATRCQRSASAGCRVDVRPPTASRPAPLRAMPVAAGMTGDVRVAAFGAGRRLNCRVGSGLVAIRAQRRRPAGRENRGLVPCRQYTRKSPGVAHVGAAQKPPDVAH